MGAIKLMRLVNEGVYCLVFGMMERWLLCFSLKIRTRTLQRRGVGLGVIEINANFVRQF